MWSWIHITLLVNISISHLILVCLTFYARCALKQSIQHKNYASEKRNNRRFEVLLICNIKVSFLIRWASFWFEWVFPVRRWTMRHLNEYFTRCSTVYIVHIESIWIFSLLMMIVDVALIHYILFLFSFIQMCFQREKVFASDMHNMCNSEFLENTILRQQCSSGFVPTVFHYS